MQLGDTPPNGGAGTGPSGSPVVMYSQLAFRNTMRLWFLGVEDTGGHMCDRARCCCVTWRSAREA